MNAGRLRIALFSTVRLNPYVSLLAEGLRQAAPAFAVTQHERLTLSWYLRERRRYDIIHLHWAELQYHAGAQLARWQRFASFLLALTLVKLSGARLVYTVHNVSHHERQHERLNQWANWVLLSWADALHVHDQSTASIVQQMIRDKERIFVIPHGSYVGYYPNWISRQEARTQLGLEEDDFVYLSLGGLRPYKGIEELIAAFSELSEPRGRLVIAGHAHEPAYAQRIRALAAGDRRILVFPAHVPDDRVQVYMNAADVCVFPYRQVTTSGAAILALSFKKPIIAPAIGPFPALVGVSAGLLYEPADPRGLLSALERALLLDLNAAARAIEGYLETISWSEVSRRHAEMYRRISHEQ